MLADWRKIWQAENLRKIWYGKFRWKIWKIPNMENLVENLRILYSCGKSAEKFIDWKICGEYGKSSGKSGLTGKSGKIENVLKNSGKSGKSGKSNSGKLDGIAWKI